MQRIITIIFLSLLGAAFLNAQAWDSQHQYEGRLETNSLNGLDNTYLNRYEPRIRYSKDKWNTHLEWETILWKNNLSQQTYSGFELGNLEWEWNWKTSFSSGLWLNLKHESNFKFNNMPVNEIGYSAEITPRLGLDFGNGLYAYIDLEWGYLNTEGTWTAIINTVPSIGYSRGAHNIYLETIQAIVDKQSPSEAEWLPGVYDFELNYEYEAWKKDNQVLALGLINKFQINTSGSDTNYRYRLEPEITYKIKH